MLLDNHRHLHKTQPLLTALNTPTSSGVTSTAAPSAEPKEVPAAAPDIAPVTEPLSRPQSPKTRIYVSDNVRPGSTVELIKTFGQRCSAAIVTTDKDKADFVVLFDRDGGKGIARRRDKIAVFKKDGDVLYSGSTRSVGNAVEDSCRAIEGNLARE